MTHDPRQPDTAHPRRVRIALAHDWLVGYRGGEAVLDRLAHLVHQIGAPAGLYTLFADGRPLTPAIDALRTVVSPLGRVPGASGALRRWLLPLYPAGVAALSRQLAADHARSPIDLLISTSSAAIKGLRAPPGVPHVCYCHSPARYIWSQTEQYARGHALRGVGLRAVRGWYQRWDRASAQHVTLFLANSTHTQREIERCFNRPSIVVHPPVRTDQLTPPAPGSTREPHWLVVSALEPYKRIDLAIHAANRARHPLLIIGAGSHQRALRAIAGPTITFAGRVDDAALLAAYRSASLLLFPQIEDFGIVACEALACGLPVVARRAGGALDIIDSPDTGALFDADDPAALLEAIERCPRPDTPALRARALVFSHDAFARNVLGAIAPLVPELVPVLAGEGPPAR